ncbi:MAG: ABC transporter permease subunit [Armatimonadota bacterium]|nr:ABC transporter permease subunit [Armatimonadota bacterium]
MKLLERRPPADSRAGRWRRAALAVFRKEMIETLRDRRTLVAAVLLPALTMPLVVLVAPALAQRQQEAWQQRPVRVAVQDDAWGPLVAAGGRTGSVRVQAVADPQTALLRGQIEAVLSRDARREGLLLVLYDESRPASVAAARSVAALAAQTLGRGPGAGSPGWGADLDRPVGIEVRNIATPERMGGALLASALPLFLAVWLLLGGQHAALDVGAGERERGTLEPLLAMPAARSALVAGKFLAVLAPAVLALIVMLSSGTGALVAGGGLLMTGPVRVAVRPTTAGLVMAVGVALAVLLSAAQLAVSLASRTLREAQQAFTGLYLVVALPAMLAPLAADALDHSWVPLVPVLNAVWAIRALLLESAAPPALAATIGSTLGLAVPILAWTGWLLGRHGRLNR